MSEVWPKSHLTPLLPSWLFRCQALRVSFLHLDPLSLEWSVWGDQAHKFMAWLMITAFNFSLISILNGPVSIFLLVWLSLFYCLSQRTVLKLFVNSKAKVDFYCYIHDNVCLHGGQYTSRRQRRAWEVISCWWWPVSVLLLKRVTCEICVMHHCLKWSTSDLHSEMTALPKWCRDMINSRF